MADEGVPNLLQVLAEGGDPTDPALLARVPERERIVWTNAELRESLLRGLRDAAEGRGEPIDDAWLDKGAGR